MLNIPGIKLLKTKHKNKTKPKNPNPSSPNSYEMPIAPQLVMAFHAYFPILSDGILSGLSVCRSPMLVLTTVVRSCFPFRSGKHCFYPPLLALTIFSISLPQSPQCLVWKSVICLSHLGLTTLSFIFCTLTSCESQIYCQRKLLS